MLQVARAEVTKTMKGELIKETVLPLAEPPEQYIKDLATILTPVIAKEIKNLLQV